MQSMKKISFILAMVLSILLFCPVDAHAQTRASQYIISGAANISQGNANGEIVVKFSILANTSVPKIGAIKIDIYRTSGDRAVTIWGNASNGLLSSKSATRYSYSYTYKGIPTVSYYAVVTVCAGTSTNYDTRTVKTSVVQAPK